MPELPEVEIERESLERWLLGRRITRAQVDDSRMRGRQSRRLVENGLAGATVRAVSRRGKYLLFDLGPRRKALVAHLGMTGTFRLQSRAEPLPRFARASLQLGRDERVVFQDPRRFGMLRLLDARERRRIAALGAEPLGPELTPPGLLALVRSSAKPIKTFLLDQRKIAGIGNIHAAESLFVARIHPTRPARSLDETEVARLFRSIRRTLSAEIARYRSRPGYLNEGAENTFRVYGRGGKPCPRCREPIARMTQEGRSTYYCPRCQQRRNR